MKDWRSFVKIGMLFSVCLFLILSLTGCHSSAKYQTVGTLVKVNDDGKTATFVYVGMGVLRVHYGNNGFVIVDDKGLNVSVSNHNGLKLGAGLKLGPVILFDEKNNLGINIESGWTKMKIEVKDMNK